ncbi:hypothetical protein K7432_006215 [Basidiobolus ranarum]|uniref:Secreted protein n=1 Tax=Basidiobolus ranarum TaxID=34480 RepID=A0ABR2W1Z5_9FUNG
MHLSIFAVALMMLIQLVCSIPLSYYPNRAYLLARPRYVWARCARYHGYCLTQVTSGAPSKPKLVPLLKQRFVTITKNHNNLNTAQAAKKKNLGVKYQDGPSVELEGEQTGFKQHEYKGRSSYPIPM